MPHDVAIPLTPRREAQLPTKVRSHVLKLGTREKSHASWRENCTAVTAISCLRMSLYNYLWPEHLGVLENGTFRSLSRQNATAP